MQSWLVEEWFLAWSVVLLVARLVEQQIGTSDGVPVLTCILCVWLKILAPPVPVLARGALSKKTDGLVPCHLVGRGALFLFVSLGNRHCFWLALSPSLNH